MVNSGAWGKHEKTRSRKSRGTVPLNSPSATCGWDLWYAGGGVDGANGSQALPCLRHNYVLAEESNHS